MSGMPPVEPAARISARSGRGSQGIAVSSMEWSWCVDVRQPFGGLLDIAATLLTLQQRPGEEAETGSPLLNLYLVVCAAAQVLGDHRHRRLYDLGRMGVEDPSTFPARALDARVPR